jgi:hypothetical protein
MKKFHKFWYKMTANTLRVASVTRQLLFIVDLNPASHAVRGAAFRVPA